MNDDHLPTPRGLSSAFPEITLGSGELREALCLAHATYERNRDRPDYNYANKLETHQVGKLGEVGAESWLRGQNIRVQPIFRDLERENECDLHTERHRIEVKSWSPPYWEPWGRCVTPKQLPWIKKKADLILWTTAEHTDERGTIRIQGWNMPKDLGSFLPHNTGPPWRPVLNHQVPIDRMRELATLLTMLTETP